MVRSDTMIPVLNTIFMLYLYQRGGVTKITTMMECEKMWRIVEAEVYVDGETARSYGIGSDNMEIIDISTHKDEISEFVSLLNRLGASEAHAYELVEDFLGR